MNIYTLESSCNKKKTDIPFFYITMGNFYLRKKLSYWSNRRYTRPSANLINKQKIPMKDKKNHIYCIQYTLPKFHFKPMVHYKCRWNGLVQHVLEMDDLVYCNLLYAYRKDAKTSNFCCAPSINPLHNLRQNHTRRWAEGLNIRTRSNEEAIIHICKEISTSVDGQSSKKI